LRVEIHLVKPTIINPIKEWKTKRRTKNKRISAAAATTKTTSNVAQVVPLLSSISKRMVLISGA